MQMVRVNLDGQNISRSLEILKQTRMRSRANEAFDGVDVNGSGIVDWNEFVFSLMGETAAEFGPLADLELLQELLTETASLLSGLGAELKDSASPVEDRQERNAELRDRLQSMKGEMNNEISKGVSKMMGIFGQNPEDLLTEDEITKLLRGTFKHQQ